MANDFWPRVSFTQGCWYWNGCKQSSGYSQVRYEGKRWLVHRLAWTLLRGAIPPGLTIDHLCRERTCVNPGHMELVTLAENGRRGSLARWAA